MRGGSNPWSPLWVTLVEPGHPSSWQHGEHHTARSPKASARTHISRDREKLWMERAALGTEGNRAGEMQSGFAEGRLCQMSGRAAGFDPGDVMPLPSMV